MEDPSVHSQLAQIHQQIKGLAEVVNEVKGSVKEITALDRTLTELVIRHDQTYKELSLQWTRVDSIKTAMGEVDRKHEELINKARGAYWSFLILGGFAQFAIISAVGWTFTHVKAAEDELILIKYRVEQIEHVKPVK